MLTVRTYIYISFNRTYPRIKKKYTWRQIYHQQYINSYNMDKETLKNLLKENLKIDIETYSEDESSVIVIRILFDNELITETYSYI